MMFYIYEIKNLLNDKTYIGQRKCPKNKIPDERNLVRNFLIILLRGEKMTFAKAIKILDLLNHDEDIMVCRKSLIKDGDYDRVTLFSKYDEIGNYMEYIVDTDNDYEFFTMDSDGFRNKKITDEGLED